jgi:hypothetical protein
MYGVRPLDNYANTNTSEQVVIEYPKSRIIFTTFTSPFIISRLLEERHRVNILYLAVAQIVQLIIHGIILIVIFIMVVLPHGTNTESSCFNPLINYPAFLIYITLTIIVVGIIYTGLFFYYTRKFIKASELPSDNIPNGIRLTTFSNN